MYKYLKYFINEKWANFLSPVLYILMLIGIAYCIFEPQTELKYLGL
jgi:hypothetical protein